jgi:hypothetical protein
VARAALLVLGLALAASANGCGGGKFVPVPGDANGGQHLQQDCVNPQWKDQNLGLWYSLCRKPLPM